MKHGFGSLEYSDKSRFVGKFAKNKKKGKG